MSVPRSSSPHTPTPQAPPSPSLLGWVRTAFHYTTPSSSPSTPTSASVKTPAATIRGKALHTDDVPHLAHRPAGSEDDSASDSGTEELYGPVEELSLTRKVPAAAQNLRLAPTRSDSGGRDRVLLDASVKNAARGGLKIEDARSNGQLVEDQTQQENPLVILTPPQDSSPLSSPRANMSFDLSPRAAHEVAKVEVVLGEEAAVEMAALQVGTSEAGSDRSSDRSRTSTPVPRARPERKMNSSSSTIGPASINSREAEPSSAPSLAQESSTGLSSQPKGVEDGAGGNGPALFAANELQASPQGLTPTEATADQRKKGRSSELSSNDVSGVATPEEPIGQLLIVEDDIERPSVQLATPRSKLWRFGRTPSVSRGPKASSSTKAPASPKTPTKTSARDGNATEIKSDSATPKVPTTPASAKLSRHRKTPSMESFSSCHSRELKLGSKSGAPKPIKVRSKNKTRKDFDRLFLTQELRLGSGDVDGANVPSTSTPGAAGPAPSPNRSADATKVRRQVKHSASMTSITSTFSSNSALPATNPMSAHQHKKRATWAMKFSMDGRYLAAAGQDAVVRVFKVLSTPQERTSEEGLRRATEVSAGGCSLGRNSKKGKGPPTNCAPVFLSEPIREYRGHTSDVLDLSWSKGNFLASSSMDKTVRLWHVSRPECLCTFGHLDFVTGVAFHPKDDRFFLSGSLDGKLRLWNIPAKKVQDSVDVPGLITACGFTLDGKTACAGTYAGALYLYDTNKLAYKSSIAVRSSKGKNAKGRKITGIEAVYAPAGGHDRLLVTSNDSRIRVYNLRDKGLERKYKGTYTNTTSQIRATISDCGQFVVSGSEDRCVYVWSYSDGEKQHKEGAQEYFYGSTSGTVTCAVMAPLVTHRHLLESEDPIQLHAKLTEQGPVVDGANWNGASAISLPSSVSSSTSSPKLESPSPPQVPSLDPRMNRIICSVDDDECIKVWRTDSYGVFGPQMPGTPATPNTPYSLGPYSGRTHAASVSSVATSNSRNSAHSREE